MQQKVDANGPDVNSVTPCYVYVLGSNGTGGARTYVGWTTDLERRLTAHNSGKGARSTRGRQWRLLYCERYEDKSDALRREWRLKRDRGFRKALSVIATDIAARH